MFEVVWLLQGGKRFDRAQENMCAPRKAKKCVISVGRGVSVKLPGKWDLLICSRAIQGWVVEVEMGSGSVDIKSKRF